MSIDVDGIKEVQVQLARMQNEAPRTAANAVTAAAHAVLTATIPVTPVRFGPLRASGRVDRASAHDLTAAVRFGGSAAPYAIYVHEILRYRHAPPTKAKFLESTVNANAAALVAGIAARASELDR